MSNTIETPRVYWRIEIWSSFRLCPSGSNILPMWGVRLTVWGVYIFTSGQNVLKDIWGKDLLDSYQNNQKISRGKYTVFINRQVSIKYANE